MKKFIVEISLFFAILFVLGLASDYWLSHKLMHRNHIEFSSWTDIVENHVDCDIALIGSSRTYLGVDPFVIDSITGLNTYNFGLEGFKFNQMYDRYCVMRAKGITPRYIVQSIDYTATLGYASFKDEQFLPYWWDKDMRRTVYKHNYNIFERYVPLLRYYGQKDHVLGSLFGYEWNLEHKKGWSGGLDRVYDPDELARLDSITFTAEPRTTQMFADYLDDVLARGIHLILVYDPIYIGKTQKVCNLQTMYDTFDSLIAGRDIPVLDYTFDTLSMDSTLFFDTEHLNAHGAHVYSIRLAHDIDSLINVCAQ